MLQVRDVVASSNWYQRTVGLRSGHGGEDFEMLFEGDEFVLQLHRLDAHEHGILQAGADAAVGSGVSLWFEANSHDAFLALVEGARSSGSNIAAEPSWNPLAHHHEATLIDPDGYIVMLHTAFDPTG